MLGIYGEKCNRDYRQPTRFPSYLALAHQDWDASDIPLRSKQHLICRNRQKTVGQASLWSLVSCRILHTLSQSAFCDQHHAEPCFAFHHASVSIISLLE